MFVVDASINRQQWIGSIMVQRIRGQIGDVDCLYRIHAPEGFESHIVVHDYNDGWMVLLKKVLDIVLRDEKEAL